MSAPLSTGRIHPAKERRDVCATPGFSTLRSLVVSRALHPEAVLPQARDQRQSGLDSRLSTSRLYLLPHGHVVEEDKLQNQMVAGELLRQGREGDGSVDAGKSRTVERVGA